MGILHTLNTPPADSSSFFSLSHFFFLPNFTSLSLVGEMLVAASLVRIENKQTTLQVDSLRLQTRWLLYNHLTAKIK